MVPTAPGRSLRRSPPFQGQFREILQASSAVVIAIAAFRAVRRMSPDYLTASPTDDETHRLLVSSDPDAVATRAGENAAAAMTTAVPVAGSSSDSPAEGATASGADSLAAEIERRAFDDQVALWRRRITANITPPDAYEPARHVRYICGRPVQVRSIFRGECLIPCVTPRASRLG